MPSKAIMRQALRACEKNNSEHRLSAVLYKGGAVIRVATNNSKTIQYRRKYFWHDEPSRHAEMNVIHGVPRDVIEKCSLLVIRLGKNNDLKSAKPCKACMMALKDSGIKKVYYSSYSGDILKLNLNEVDAESYTKEYFEENYGR